MKKILLSLLLLFVAGLLQAQMPNTDRKVSNVTAFARLYGYVRYFHPSDEAAGLNWEQFLYHGVREVENAESAAELVKKLNALFKPVAPSILINAPGSRAAFGIQAITPAETKGMKEISWQHYGLGLAPGLYRSIRTNRPSTVYNEKSNGFGTATASVDAVPLRGKEIRLRAWIKTDASNGQGQMWLRVDREGRKMGFFNNMDDRPIKNSSWKQYEIIGNVAPDAEHVVFGTFLSGLGKVWVDNFSLEVKENNTWTKVAIKNPSFEVSAEKAADWWAQSPAYKYKVVQGDAAEGKNALLISDHNGTKMEESIFKPTLSFGTSFSKDIGQGITVTVPQVLWGTEKATYPSADAKTLDELLSRMKASEVRAPSLRDPYVRLSGVIITWNVFKHFYPYHDEINTAWAEQLPGSLAAAYKATDYPEYLVVLREMTEKLKDGHVSISLPAEKNYFSILAAAALAEGKVVISQVDSAFEYKNQLREGDIVTSVDGVPALQKLGELKRLVSGSEQWKNHRALTDIFTGPQGSTLVLKIKRAGAEEQELRLKRMQYRYVKDTSTIRKLNDSTFYINIGATEMKDIKAQSGELLKAKGIICDLRGYPRNNHELINYLLTVKDTSKWMFVPRITQPDFQNVSYEGMGWNMSPSNPHITAKVVFLTGGGAISYAESYMGFIKNYKLATIVGQPTAGANGNVNTFKLPGGVSIRFTGMKVRQQDGSPLQGKGIAPDILVSQTIKGIAEGRDEYLEKALEVLSMK